MKDANYKLAMTLFIAKHEQELREYMKSGVSSMGDLIKLKKAMFGNEYNRKYTDLISQCCSALNRRDANAS